MDQQKINRRALVLGLITILFVTLVFTITSWSDDGGGDTRSEVQGNSR